MPGGPTRLHWIILAVILALTAAHAWHRAFFIDDAYISFRYARNLVDGNGLVFNPHERVEGYTNFSWTLLIAAVMAAGLPPVVFSQILGITAALILLVILYRWGLRLGMDPSWALLAPAMLAVNRTYAAWSTGGLETRLFTLLLVAAAFRLSIESEDGAEPRLPVSALLFGLACLTRPEGLLAAGVAGGCLLAGMARNNTTGTRRHAAGWLVTMASIVCAHLAWRHAYYGAWLPNSFAAKVPGLRLTSGAVYLGLVFIQHLALVCVMVAAHLIVTRQSFRNQARLISASLKGFVVPFCVLYTVYLLLIGGDHFEFRFADPLIPFLFLGAAMLTASHHWPRPGHAVAATSLTGLMLLSAGASSITGFSDFDRQVSFGGNTQYVSIVSVETEAGFLQRWERIGRWLASNAAPGESIGVRPAGAIPYLSGLRTLDMLGINDRDVARLPVLPGQNIGHERFVDDDYVRRRGVTYMIGSPEIHLEKPVVVGRHVVEVDFGDFYWYFWPLQPEAAIRPGTRVASGTGG